jgi:glyoxylase-like metal-dependent hydrolase (beta-lactamase superfamily II)
METVAPGVMLIQLWRGYRTNAYVLEDVLVDTGTRWDYGRLRRELATIRLTQIVLTHAHPDHQGCAHRLCTDLKIQLACPAADVDAMEGRVQMPPNHPVGNLVVPLFGGPPQPVARALNDGDFVGEFRVVHAPGHTPGHSMLFRERDGLLIAGDVMANINFLTGRDGLREPPHRYSTNWQQNRESILKAAELKPSLICFGHGRPLAPPDGLREFVLSLQ